MGVRHGNNSDGTDKLILSWNAPMDNCDGSPLMDLDHFELPVYRAEIIGDMPCDPDDPAAGTCPIYLRTLVRWLTTMTSVRIPDPGLGEVLGYEWPVAVDAAGNTSEACQ